AGEQHLDGPPVVVLIAAIACYLLQQLFAARHSFPRQFVEELESFDALEFLGRYPRTGFAGHIIELRPCLERSRQSKTAGDGFDDQRAARIRLEVVNRRQEVRTHRTQFLCAIETGLDIRIALVREADDERKVAGNTVLDHLLGSLEDLLDLDVLANALQYLVGTRLHADQQAAQAGLLATRPHRVRKADALIGAHG